MQRSSAAADAPSQHSQRYRGAAAPMQRLPAFLVLRCSLVDAVGSCDAAAMMLQSFIGAPVPRLPPAVGAAMLVSTAGVALQRPLRRRSCDVATATTPELHCSSSYTAGAAMPRP